MARAEQIKAREEDAWLKAKRRVERLKSVRREDEPMPDHADDLSLKVSPEGLLPYLVARLEEAQGEIAKLQAQLGLPEDGGDVMASVAAAQRARADELAVLLEAERLAHAATASRLVVVQARLAAAEARL